VEDCPESDTLEEEHHRTRTVGGVHEHHCHSLLALIIQVDPVLLVELQVNLHRKGSGELEWSFPKKGSLTTWSLRWGNLSQISRFEIWLV
jgi:hypothetical protein